MKSRQCGRQKKSGVMEVKEPSLGPSRCGCPRHTHTHDFSMFIGGYSIRGVCEINETPSGVAPAAIIEHESGIGALQGWSQQALC